MEQQSKNMEGLSEEATKKLDTIVSSILKGDISMQQAMGVTEEQIEAMYAVAYNLFVNEKYTEALDAFVFASFIAPHNYKVMLGMASCAQVLENYAEALILFTYCCALEPNNPAPLLHAAECYMAINDKDAAKYSLELALQCSDDNATSNAVKARAEIILANIGE